MQNKLNFTSTQSFTNRPIVQKHTLQNIYKAKSTAWYFKGLFLKSKTTHHISITYNRSV
jgi:hypothetical protein